MKYVYEAIVEPVGRFLEVRFPDLGIITQGEDLQDAAFRAQDLLENHIVMRGARPFPYQPSATSAAPMATAWALWWSATRIPRRIGP